MIIKSELIGFLICYFNMFSIYVCFCEIERKKIIVDLYKLFIIFLFTLIIYILYLYNLNNLKLILLMPCFIAEYLLLVQKNVPRSVVLSLVIYAVDVTIDILFFAMLKKLILYYHLSIIIESDAFINSLSIFLSICLICLFKSKYINKYLDILCSKLADEKRIYLFLVFLFYISLNLILFKTLTNQIPLYLSILFYLLCSGVVILLLVNVYNLSKIDTENSYLINLNNIYGNILEEDKIYKHNIKNKLLIIKSIGNKKVQKIVDDYLDESEKNVRETNSLYKIPNSLKGIFGEKLYVFKKTKIIVYNDLIKDEFKTLTLTNYRKLCEIIGISLDNASEATKNLVDGYIYIGFNIENNNIVIKICNNFSGTIDIDKLGQKKYSTKNRGSGYGIYSVLHIKEIETKYEIKDNEFITQISIKKSKVR